MRRLALMGFAISLALATPLRAQAPAPPAASSSRLTWDQAAPDLATAQGYTYRQYADGATTGAALAGVTCVAYAGTQPGLVATCAAPFPAFTPGPHTVTITAGNLAGESAPSSPFAFVFVVVPATPVNVRLGS